MTQGPAGTRVERRGKYCRSWLRVCSDLLIALDCYKISKKGKRMQDAQHPESGSRKRDESLVFIFLVVFLFPLLAVAIVGGYGFVVWMIHHFIGPPGPPL